MTGEPRDEDAEKCVIGAILLDARTVLDDVTGILRPEDFHAPKHELIYATATRLHAAGKAVDAITVAAALTEAGEATRAGGQLYLAECMAAIPSVANAGWYAETVRDRADRRRVTAAGTALHQAAQTGTTAEDARAAARAILDGLDTRDTSLRRLGDDVDEILNLAESGPTRGMPTPWPELDDLLGGLRPGTLVTVGARPGVGKSAVGHALAAGVAMRGRSAVVFSLEMSTVDVNRRVLSSVTGVDYRGLMRGGVSEADWSRAARHRSLLDSLPVYVDGRSHVTAGDVRAASRDLSRRTDLGLVVVDYLQLMAPSDRRAPREQQVADMSRQLKVLAGDLGVPVVVMSQLNREVEKRQDKHPTLADLRESGAIEQDSDVVLLLFRDEEQSPDVMEVGVLKNRFGERGAVRLVWQGQFQRVVSPTLRAAS